MFKISFAVVGIAMGLMAGTALYVGRNGPPASVNTISDAQMTMDKTPSFVVKPDPKLNGTTRHRIDSASLLLMLDQVATPAAAPASAPSVAPVVAPASTPATTTPPDPAPSTAQAPAATPAPAPQVKPDVAPPGIPPLLSTDLTAPHTKSKGGFLDFLRFIISSVARFMSTAEDNLFVIMFGVAGTMFMATAFWWYHGVSETRHKSSESGGTGGSCDNGCKTKGPCH